MPDRITLSDVIDARWASASGRLAVQEPGTALTFEALHGWSQTISASLATVGLVPGQRVALVMPNSAAFVASFFGVGRAGGVVAPLNPHYRARELAYFIADLDPVAVLTTPALADVVAPVTAALARPPALLMLDDVGEPRLAHPGSGDATILTAAGSPPLLQQYTSGSTGNPKRVVRSHRAVLDELDTLQQTFDVTTDDRFLGLAPFCHVNGLVRTMLNAMHATAALYPVPEFDRRGVLDLITRERLTFFGGVPQMFAILGQTPVRGAVDLSSLRVVFSSSARLTTDDARRCQRRYDIVVRQLYGSTETGTISFNRDPDPERTVDSVGTPLPGVTVDVVGDAGEPLSAGQEGEIVVASPFAADGYLDNAEATKRSFRDGAYVTGDVGMRDATGALRLTGRTSLMINRGGFKVSPYEVEEVVAGHPNVTDVAVVRAPSPHGDDVIRCVVVTREACTADEIIDHCRARLADFKVPGLIEFRDALPKSAAGKILRAQL